MCSLVLFKASSFSLIVVQGNLVCFLTIKFTVYVGEEDNGLRQKIKLVKFYEMERTFSGLSDE